MCSKWRILWTVYIIEIIHHRLHVEGINASLSSFTDLIQERIVGGVPTKLGQYPYYAIPFNDYLCGATLLWKDILVSAAHCKANAWVEGIYLGGNLLDGSQSLYFGVKNSYIHPLYNEQLHENDIMIIHLNQTVPDNIPYAQINRDPTIPKNKQGITAVGFGAIYQDGPISDVLLAVNLYKTSYKQCQKGYPSDKIIDNLMICNGGDGKDTCQGDSGGPMLLQGTDIVAGIVSFGDGCAQPHISGVNTRVSAYADWIDDMICQVSSNPPISCSLRNANNNDIISSLLSTNEAVAFVTNRTKSSKKPASCFNVGDSCQNNQDCCSNQCTGRLLNRACR